MRLCLKMICGKFSDSTRFVATEIFLRFLIKSNMVTTRDYVPSFVLSKEISPHFLFGGFTADFGWVWWTNTFTNQKANHIQL